MTTCFLRGGARKEVKVKIYPLNEQPKASGTPEDTTALIVCEFPMFSVLKLAATTFPEAVADPSAPSTAALATTTSSLNEKEP